MTYEDYKKQEAKRLEIVMKHMENGVDFIDIYQAYIDESVKIGKGTVIYPCVVLKGNTVIGENCLIGQNTRIEDSEIGNGTDIQSSVILKSTVGEETHVGPFAYMRPDSHVGSHCKVGDFVEVKNSTMGDGAKASHLTYIGDSDVGRDVNLGCGVVFVNYNGHSKSRCEVADGAFIGCNTNLVAPVKVGEKAYIAAGSTVTKDVPAGALRISRAREQKDIEGYVERTGILKKDKK
ncbi:MAG: UDP-N-acetylglucosamine diphosphorylase [Firmicutes bacterium]|nr:UDP-N-acetylglucosamine diphosphorylase [Bacillota bacterium]